MIVRHDSCKLWSLDKNWQRYCQTKRTTFCNNVKPWTSIKLCLRFYKVVQLHKPC